MPYSSTTRYFPSSRPVCASCGRVMTQEDDWAPLADLLFRCATTGCPQHGCMVRIPPVEAPTAAYRDASPPDTQTP